MCKKYIFWKKFLPLTPNSPESPESLESLESPESSEGLESPKALYSHKQSGDNFKLLSDSQILRLSRLPRLSGLSGLSTGLSGLFNGASLAGFHVLI